LGKAPHADINEFGERGCTGGADHNVDWQVDLGGDGLDRYRIEQAGQEQAVRAGVVIALGSREDLADARAGGDLCSEAEPGRP
jgi:hypothetical protein